jgi:hypothetical protein
MPTPAEILRQQIPNIDQVSDTPFRFGKKFGIYMPDFLVRSEFIREIKESVALTKEQEAGIKVQRGIISAPEIKEIERILGLKEDGIADKQLQAAMANDEVKTLIRRMMLGDRTSALELPATQQHAAVSIEVPHVPLENVQKQIARG